MKRITCARPTVRAMAAAFGAVCAFVVAPIAPAVATNPCAGNNPPPSCSRPPVPSTYYVDSPSLMSMSSVPQFNGNATITTTMWVRRVYNRSTNSEVSEWFVSDHHVVNNMLFVNTTVSMYERVYYNNQNGFYRPTNGATVTVTAVLLDAGNSTADSVTSDLCGRSTW